jgi:hypothetical protein
VRFPEDFSTALGFQSHDLGDFAENFFRGFDQIDDGYGIWKKAKHNSRDMIYHGRKNGRTLGGWLVKIVQLNGTT